MNAIQLRKRKMYYVVEDQLVTVPQATIDSMPNFDVLFQKYRGKVSDIRIYSASQTTSRLGYSRVKIDLKVVMVARAIDVASRIRAYAMNTDNGVLEAEMDQRISYLGKRPDSVCADICSFIHSKGSSLLADLGDYGVTNASLTDLKQAFIDFTASIPKPKNAINNRVADTKTIVALFAECDGLLKEMDVLAEMLRYSNPSFYEQYVQSRKLEKPGYRTIDFMGDVTDADGMPLGKVTLRIGDTGIVKETTAKGQFVVKNLPSGIYSVVFSKAGYVDTSIQMAVTKTERTEVNVTLEAQSDINSSAA